VRVAKRGPIRPELSRPKDLHGYLPIFTHGEAARGPGTDDLKL
jgi:hypothetical protein